MTAIEQTPDWPTAVRSRLSGGRVLGVDNSVWLYRTVPLAPVVDAASPAESVEPAEPLLAAFDELAAITTVGLKRRAASKGNYRRIHLLLVNLPWEYDPAPGPIAEYLADSYRGRVVDRRVLMFGVRLVDKIGNRGGLRAAVDSVVETLVSGGRPISDFDVDTAAVEAALTRSGLATPTHEEFAAVEAWWNHGVHADTPVLEHTDHLHVFSEIAAVETAAAEPLNCSNWPADDGRHAITFATVKEFDGGVVPVDSPAAWWVPALLAEGALAVSIRGLIEPCEITREELRRRKKQILDDLRERVTADKLERSEQDEMFQMVTAVEADYAGPVPPTLVDASVLVAFDGKVGDMAEVARGSGLLLRSMDMRQRQAWAETMVASAVSANPYLHDLPAQLIACSGLPSLSRVGDADGAQLGFTERDRQPVFLSPEAASKSDSAPLVLCAGSTGSGKTVAMQWMADNFARMGRPTVIIDPKMGSDLSAAVLSSGGQVASLDSLAAADGVFDPIRFATSAESAAELASSMLMAVNPWGSAWSDYETPLMRALSFGVRDAGAQCVGEALKAAERAGHAPPEMVRKVFDLAEASPMFRACVGINPGTSALRISDGITLIKVGNAHLDLPDARAVDKANQQQRVALALVRMMVFGSAMALTGRAGVVMLDEAWVFLGSNSDDLEKLGRLARSQQVLPMLFTQRVSDAIEAKLTGYISRGIILPLSDPAEAHAACQLFGLDPTPERIARITDKATIGGGDNSHGASMAQPNWRSMRHLRDPNTGATLRGTVAIYADLAGRAVPVEIAIPQSFIAMASTNPDDIRRRLELEAGPR